MAPGYIINARKLVIFDKSKIDYPNIILYQDISLKLISYSHPEAP